MSTGTIHDKKLHERSTDIVYKCMQVKFDTIQKMIKDGIIELEAIQKKTGAGTLCGGCQASIKCMLGVNVWQYVKITKIIEHNDSVRSYIFTPMSQAITLPKSGQHIVYRSIHRR